MEKEASGNMEIELEEQKDLGVITETDRYLFGEGTHYEIYKKMGAHPMELNGQWGVYFAVWAPKAKNVSIVGDFNGWMGYNHNMKPLGTSGIFELFIPNLGEGTLYKYAVTGANGMTVMKSDPYGVACEFRPNTASIVRNINGFAWTDADWMTQKRTKDIKKAPMSIYEVHIGSWKKNGDTERAGFYNYRDMAHELAAYVEDMGYTHIELMGIAEHPFDGSWGYQVTGYFAPTARYGTAQDLMYFINYMHERKIGVILDWVPAHFPRDAHGLANFDGTPTYEYADPRKGEHPDWGTKVFDFGRREVVDFLISNAIYWVEEYHVDGLRVDAVASMLYLDYGRNAGQWVPNWYGGHENLEAIEFFKHLNSIMERRDPGTMINAEESTAWPKVTARPEDDGLGFTHKWNMGWMNDFLEYVKRDALFKKYAHDKMTFSMTYAYSENYILVLSHDEVVHLKCSMLEKMPGYYEDKFKNLKAAYTFMFGHPGKKLLFMGQEFAQLREWSEERSLDWYLLEEQPHQDMKEYVKTLLHLYKEHPAMTECDDSWEGFEWMNCEDGDRSTFSYVRKNQDQSRCLLFVFNFTPIAREDYRVGVPNLTEYRVILDSNQPDFGKNANTIYKAEEIECDKQEQSIAFPLQPLSAYVMEFSNIHKKKKAPVVKKVVDKKLVRLSKKNNRNAKKK